MADRYDYVIVGAGITGLAAAFELSERNVPFTVLEASDRAGGLILTERVDGFTIEAGPDSLLAQKPAGIGLCEELGLGPRLITTTPPRTSYVLHRGRLYPLPARAVLGVPTTLSGVLGYDLPSEGVACVEFAQSGPQPLLRVATQFGIGCHVMADGDAAGLGYAEVSSK